MLVPKILNLSRTFRNRRKQLFKYEIFVGEAEKGSCIGGKSEYDFILFWD